MARYHRLCGDDVFFLTGVDEHGQNIERIAAEKGISEQKYCDSITAQFMSLWEKLEISNDYFVRTTSERHKKAAQKLFRAVYDAGDVYRAPYEGWYCIPCERFYREKELLDNRPDCILVYGDTNSTLAGALAGSKLQLPVAHVEAGLRSYNRAMPEELNRVIVDQISVLLFCPSKNSADNLRSEGIGVKGQDSTIGPKEYAHTPEIIITGDVMVDTIRIFCEKASEKLDLLNHLCIKAGSYILATVHRQENTDNLENLLSIIKAFELLAKTGTPVVLPLHPRTQKFIDQNSIKFSRGIIITEPVSYLEMLMLIENSVCVLTDSGGLQKEALIIGRPCVTIRTETEWTETVETGWNIVAGVKSERIVEAYHTVLNHTVHEKEPPQGLYGDGHAADRIMTAIEKRFS